MKALQRSITVQALVLAAFSTCGCGQGIQPTPVDMAAIEARIASLEERVEKSGKNVVRQATPPAVRVNAPSQPSTTATLASIDRDAATKLATSIVRGLDDREREMLAIRLLGIAEGKTDQINRGPIPSHFSTLTGGQCEEVVLAAEWRSLANHNNQHLRWAAQKLTKRAALKLSHTTLEERTRCMEAVEGLMNGQPDARAVRFLNDRIGPDPYLDAILGKRAVDPDLVAKLANAIIEAKADLQ